MFSCIFERFSQVEIVALPVRTRLLRHFCNCLVLSVNAPRGLSCDLEGPINPGWLKCYSKLSFKQRGAPLWPFREKSSFGLKVHPDVGFGPFEILSLPKNPNGHRHDLSWAILCQEASFYHNSKNRQNWTPNRHFKPFLEEIRPRGYKWPPWPAHHLLEGAMCELGSGGSLSAWWLDFHPLVG